jgi:hypothetical protein
MRVVPNEPVSAADFVNLLVNRVPSARLVVDEHLTDQEGDLLLHVLMADLGRYAQSAFDHGDMATSDALLAVVDDALRHGDADVVNAVQVSFVENLGPWDSAMRPFISSWPKPLRDEAGRQAQLR